MPCRAFGDSYGLFDSRKETYAGYVSMPCRAFGDSYPWSQSPRPTRDRCQSQCPVGHSVIPTRGYDDGRLAGSGSVSMPCRAFGDSYIVNKTHADAIEESLNALSGIR